MLLILFKHDSFKTKNNLHTTKIKMFSFLNLTFPPDIFYLQFHYYFGNENDLLLFVSNENGFLHLSIFPIFLSLPHSFLLSLSHSLSLTHSLSLSLNLSFSSSLRHGKKWGTQAKGLLFQQRKKKIIFFFTNFVPV